MNENKLLGGIVSLLPSDWMQEHHRASHRQPDKRSGKYEAGRRWIVPPRQATVPSRVLVTNYLQTACTCKHMRERNLAVVRGAGSVWGCQRVGFVAKARVQGVCLSHQTATFIDSVRSHTHTYTRKLTPIFTTRTGTHNTSLTILLAPNRFSHFTLWRQRKH